MTTELRTEPTIVEEQNTMHKYVLLVPLNYNDGSDVPKDVLDEVYNSIYELAGGYYIAGTGVGAYRMDSGEKAIDRCAQVWIVVDESDVIELKAVVRRIGRLLGQESMYLEDAGPSRVDFVS